MIKFYLYNKHIDIESEARIEELETILGHSDSQITELKTELGTYKVSTLTIYPNSKSSILVNFDVAFLRI